LNNYSNIQFIFVVKLIVLGRNRKKRILENIEITDIADKGKAVGRHDGRVVFVADAVPGDVVDVLIQKTKKGNLIGKAIKLNSPSEDRIQPVCEHFGVCGGCKWQHLDYPAQLKYKEQTVRNAFQRIGKVPVAEFLPILGAKQTEYYRNKLEFSFSNKRWLTEEEVNSDTNFGERNALGFHRPGAFDKIVDVNHCWLQPDPSNAIRNAVRAYALEHDLAFFDIREQKGLLRQLFVRVSSVGEVMVLVSFFQHDKARVAALLDHLKETFPEITSLMYVINGKKNDTIYDLPIQLWAGKAFLVEQLRNVQFKVGPKSFFQTNTAQAVTLYDTVLEFAELKGTENVYDLYTGIGSIASYVAAHCKTIVGIEEIASAIEDAKENVKLNGIKNATFYAGDVKDILDEHFIAQHSKPDLVITDPPRAGMHKNVVETLLKLSAPRIVYVSCNPASQARDINLLSEQYEVVKVRPVDMFPHTHHIESVALLTLKDK